MRRRLCALLLLMMGSVLVGLSVPIAEKTASTRIEEMYVDRLNDTARFAWVAEQASTDGDNDSLTEDLVRYREVYGVTAFVLDRTDHVVVGHTDPRAPLSEQTLHDIHLAVAGHQTPPPGARWPGDDTPLVVAVPVIRSGDVVGAAVTVSSTTALRERVAGQLGLLAVIDLAVLVFCVLGANWLATWVLRPVFTLDHAVHDIASGDLGRRVPATHGPVELRRLTASINKMAAVVERNMRRQRDFACDASHQLRNPLTALTLRLDLLGCKVAEQAGQEFAEVRREADRLRRVVDKLLELATASEVAADPEAVTDLADLAAERIRAWQPLAATSDVRLKLMGVTAPARVDPALIGSALDAVLDNAIRFSGHGGRVTVLTAVGSDGALLTVTDDGPGLRPGEFDRIGDRLWRSPRNQNVPGSGLGLAIVREMLDAAGGRVAFEPALPHGLRVVLAVPAAVPASASGFGVGRPGTG